APSASETRLGAFLNRAVESNPNLQAYVLVWDFAMIYALERELLPIYKLGWRTHSRFHFHMDGNHPLGASHHQKIVVIDDSLAFAGGIDLTKCRWDTSDHTLEDPRRNDRGCTNHEPFHDAQMAVDGEAAGVLGQLVRERWYRATGQRIPPVLSSPHDPWPDELGADVEDLEVAVSRTEPSYKGRPEVREVVSLYLDSIQAAKKYIYLENQYLTSSVICHALSAKLSERDCPEIVIVLPRKSSGWFEEGTMDALRSRILKKLRSADRQGKLRIYFPVLPGGLYLNVHAKISIIDDDFARLGSSNLSNRSMGFDTECDLSVEAGGEVRLEEGIRRLRARLLAEHLGVPEKAFDSAMRKSGSLIATIEGFRGGERTLEILDGGGVQKIFDSYVYDTSLIDPECPAPPTELIEQFVPDAVKRSGLRPLFWGILTLFVLLGFAAAWTWTPLKHWLNLDLLLYYTSLVSEMRAAPLLVLGAYVIGGLIQFPVTLLIVATAIAFEPLSALLFSLSGCIASAGTLYWLGRFLGREALRRFGGERLNRLSRKLGKQGLL
ncbi:MAG: phospholipase D-like domain-containing protein, partial [Syntrophobacteraceae bacterium]